MLNQSQNTSKNNGKEQGGLSNGAKSVLNSSFNNQKCVSEARRATPNKRSTIKVNRGRHLQSPPVHQNKDLEHIAGKNVDYVGF